jgi:hypothetical protein
MIRLFLVTLFAVSLPAAGKTCKPSQGELALAFAEVRARLAVAAGQCMGYSTDVDSQQFSRFLTRHKEWAINGDQWSGQELLRVQQAKGNPRSVGSQHYANLIYQEQESARNRKWSNYCADAVTEYRQWVEMKSPGLEAGLKQKICLKEQIAEKSPAQQPPAIGAEQTAPVGN